ncbi:hypothetical protein PR202_ga14015 [Eleusine coracana subsp. coracana]|uniref:Uncharacterized protein n=1 Tax=Eleusine coracana subsp. coracana TaxID=191504 RepID=A0AAV5CFP5_ELECO|nr:hypothetical protein PR202_ga14015 [Eleusine coracana subsp. coracana]
MRHQPAACARPPLSSGRRCRDATAVSARRSPSARALGRHERHHGGTPRRSHVRPWSHAHAGERRCHGADAVRLRGWFLARAAFSSGNRAMPFSPAATLAVGWKASRVPRRLWPLAARLRLG